MPDAIYKQGTINTPTEVAAPLVEFPFINEGDADTCIRTETWEVHKDHYNRASGAILEPGTPGEIGTLQIQTKPTVRDENLYRWQRIYAEPPPPRVTGVRRVAWARPGLGSAVNIAKTFGITTQFQTYGPGNRQSRVAATNLASFFSSGAHATQPGGYGIKADLGASPGFTGTKLAVITLVISERGTVDSPGLIRRYPFTAEIKDATAYAAASHLSGTLTATQVWISPLRAGTNEAWCIGGFGGQYGVNEYRWIESINAVGGLDRAAATVDITATVRTEYYYASSPDKLQLTDNLLAIYDSGGTVTDTINSSTTPSQATWDAWVAEGREIEVEAPQAARWLGNIWQVERLFVKAQ